MPDQRNKVLTKVVDTNEYTIYNPQSMDWSLFPWAEGYFKHYITYDEIYKFYLIPYVYYGVSEYSDVILLLNDIPTEFDLYPGALIKIPKYDELRSFIFKYAKN